MSPRTSPLLTASPFLLCPKIRLGPAIPSSVLYIERPASSPLAPLICTLVSLNTSLLAVCPANSLPPEVIRSLSELLVPNIRLLPPKDPIAKSTLVL